MKRHIFKHQSHVCEFEYNSSYAIRQFLALFNNVLPTVSNGRKTIWMKLHNRYCTNNVTMWSVHLATAAMKKKIHCV